MKGSEILRIVDAIHRDKNVDKEIVFEGIEQAILSAARKHFGEEELIETIHRLVRGERLLTEIDIAEMRRAARQNRPGLNPATGQRIRLTDRENDVLQGLAAGLSDKQIARDLGVSVETVRTHVKGIFNKLGAGSRLQALALAVRYGLVYFR